MEENKNIHQRVNFEGYDQTEKIGEGGMATVWKARQISLDRWVAIKVLSPEQCSDEDEIDRFQAEARTVARLNHSGIVQVYDAFYRNDRFCFVMEFVDGYTVGAWLKTRGYLAQEECLFVATGIAEALLYAWNKHKLIHCDIKPENIMIDVDGSVKITDFGLSKNLSGMQSRKNSLEGGYVFGTPAYIAPEQAAADRYLTIHADMYALGASLYHMSTGTRLFSELSAEEAMNGQVNGQYTDPYELNTKLSPFFCDFIERLLCKNRNDRYSRWEEVLEEIENLKKGQPLIYGEIDTSKTVSTVRRSGLRDAARSALLKKLNIRQRTIKEVAEPPSVLEASPKIKIELAGEDDPWKSICTTRVPYRDGWGKIKATAHTVKNTKYFRLAVKSLIGLATLAIIVSLVFHFDQQEKTRVMGAAQSELSEIDDFCRRNPAAYHVAIQRCNTLISHLDGPAYTALRQSVLMKRKLLEDARKKHIEKVMKDLLEEIQPLREQRQFLRAASIVSSFNGEMANETLHERMQLADTLNEQAARSNRTRSASGNE